MRKKISFKGVIWGAIVDVGGSNIWGLIAGIYIAAKYQIFLLPHAQQAARLQGLMFHDPVISVLNTIIGSGFSVLGGYVAARIAKHNELLNGTLSSFLCEVFTVAAIGSVAWWIIIVSFIGNPLLGLAGGYIQLWRREKTTEKHHKAK